MAYVFDASFVVALIIPDEKNPKVDNVQKALSNTEEIYVPNLLWYEAANIFKNLLRRKRYTAEEIENFFPLFFAVRLTTDFENGADYSKKLWNLSKVYDLTSYDAAYLELAERKKAVLCTLDEDLKTAAKKHGVTVLDRV
jgi:predicted nucleic acid-binding protein